MEGSKMCRISELAVRPEVQVCVCHTPTPDLCLCGERGSGITREYCWAEK